MSEVPENWQERAIAAEAVIKEMAKFFQPGLAPHQMIGQLEVIGVRMKTLEARVADQNAAISAIGVLCRAQPRGG